MTNNFPFVLDRRHRLQCPACGKSKCFSPYIVVATGEPVDDTACGRCNRLYKCAYHLPPRQYFRNNDKVSYRSIAERAKTAATPVPKAVKAERLVIPELNVNRTLGRDLDLNPLYGWMTDVFGRRPDCEATVRRVFGLYRTATSKLWNGSTLFWMTDSDGRTADGKIMGFDRQSGHRVRSPRPLITWVSSLLATRNRTVYDVPYRPLFGEHLGRDCRDAAILIVESEKTALLLSVRLMYEFGSNALRRYLPMAAGGCGGLSEAKMERLAQMCGLGVGRRIVFIPDNGCYDKWTEAAARLQRSGAQADVSVSRIMEHPFDGIEPDEGADIGDLIVTAEACA